MKTNVRLLAILSVTGTLSSAHAADPSPVGPIPSCDQVFIYAIKQLCAFQPFTGLSQCQPVGLVGPGPTCPTASEQPLQPVPLAPPVFYSPQWPGPGLNPYQAPAGMPMPALPTMPALPIMAPFSAIAAPAVSAPAHQNAPENAGALPISPAPQPIPAPLTQDVASIPTAAAAQPTERAATSNAPASPAAPTSEPRSEPLAEPTPLTPLETSAPIGTPIAEAPVTTPPAEANATQDALAHFEFDSAALTEAGRAAIDAWFEAAPKNKVVHVTGHADRLGPDPYNQRLSLRRAQNVAYYLIKKGFKPKLIKITGMGERVPVKECEGGLNADTIACLSPNRRVKIDLKQ